MTKTVERALFEITPEIQHFAELCEKNNVIERELYAKVEKMAPHREYVKMEDRV